MSDGLKRDVKTGVERAFSAMQASGVLANRQTPANVSARVIVDRLKAKWCRAGLRRVIRSLTPGQVKARRSLEQALGVRS